MVTGVGDLSAVGRGELLRLPEIMKRTGMAEGTIRSRYHAGTFGVLWKLGRRLVVWERDLVDWLDKQQAATRKSVADTNWESPFADILAAMPDVMLAQRAVIRERTIREIMSESGEPREVVAELVDASASMAQEAVLDLAEGEPTTLRDALNRYLESLEEADEGAVIGVDGVINHLDAILDYPYPAGSGQVGSIEVDEETEDESAIIKVDGQEVYRANHDEHGYAGMSAARQAAEAVYRAVRP